MSAWNDLNRIAVFDDDGFLDNEATAENLAAHDAEVRRAALLEAAKIAERYSKVIAVHRLAYEVAVGAIPDGYVIDHVRERGCRFRDCIEPRHLEAVTQAENVARIPSERLRYEAASPQPTYEARAVERFLAKCVVDGTTGCWNWISDPKWAPPDSHPWAQPSSRALVLHAWARSVAPSERARAYLR